jgi:hypothetical protein
MHAARSKLAILESRADHRGRLTLVGLSCLATAVACGPDAAPELTGLGDQVAQVGRELTLEIHGTDPDGDRLRYGFAASDLTDLEGRAEMTQSPSGAGVFRWTPLAADLGVHAIDFTASDGTRTAKVTIAIDVRSAIGAATAPVFRQPLGSGTTLDLARAACVELDIVVDDPDTASVAIAEGEPRIDDAELRATGGLTAAWHWCPTREQAAEPRYTLVLVADDGDNPQTVKNYLVVLRGGSGASCPGAAPVIAHASHDATSTLDLAIEATIRDDRGVKDAPLVYYTETPPAEPLDLSALQLVPTALISGDPTNGVYRATIANPVAGAPAGTQQTLYYVWVASDDDDPTGTCDHATTSPVYAMTVTSSGAISQPVCSACTSDAQCGAGNECVRMGAAGDSFCLAACDGGCPAGSTCSASELPSIDGHMARQCVPDSGACESSGSTCSDDAWEGNDSRSEASHNPALPPDLHDLVSCPSPTSPTRANDDWYKLVLTGDQQVDLELAGGDQTDLDLHLYHSDGTAIAASTSFESYEVIEACLPPATYYIKVNGFGSARNEYLLLYDTHAATCRSTSSGAP